MLCSNWKLWLLGYLDLLMWPKAAKLQKISLLVYTSIKYYKKQITLKNTNYKNGERYAE